MAAYIIARVRITNADQYGQYKLLTPAAVAAQGGQFIVRGAEHEVLEGDADERRIVVLEFPTSNGARTFYDSSEYVEARAVRSGAAEMEMVLVEGV